MDHAEEQVAADHVPLTQDEFRTLKHRLAGPSITKAGQGSVDQKKVSEIIYNVSKGSKFFVNEENKDKALTIKIDRILARKRQLEKLDLGQELRKADTSIAQLEFERDLSQTIVHLDCDAFYAAVEELDNPHLKEVPFAVGVGVLTTCNYHARKFGCRSGMAGFVAKALCPQLVSLPLNFGKYTAKATEVRAVIAEYDPQFESASIDEAYLNITQYCDAHEITPEEAVHQMRRQIHETCKITVSGGIAPNAKLAKICSNQNKPNGQYRIPPDRVAILAFMRALPVRKVNGIGRVFERELEAIGVKTCGDIYQHRAMLTKLFGDKAFHFLLQCYLGLGRTSVAPLEESTRKSVGTESTFSEMSGTSALRDKLRHIAEELEKDMVRTKWKGRTLVLKIKLHTYEVLTRQTVPPFAVWKAEDLYRFALPMLTKLEKEYPGIKLRLMGLRCTSLVSTAKSDKNFFGLSSNVKDEEAAKTQRPALDQDGWEIWPEEEDFEEAERREREDEWQELEQLSQEHEQDQKSALQGVLQKEARDDNQRFSHGKMRNVDIVDKENEQQPAVEPATWDCPICGLAQAADDRLLNAHIDLCLSRQAIRDVVRDTHQQHSDPDRASPAEDRGVTKKRKGAESNLDGHATGSDIPKQKKLFFS